MVTVTTDITDDQYAGVVSVIRTVTLATATLTPRSEKQLYAALRAHNLAVAYDGATIVGWLIATPYSTTVQELGMAYIVPAYRNNGLFVRLVDTLIEKRPASLAVTYEMRLKQVLQDTWGFEPSSLGEFIRMSQGLFLLYRFLSVQSIIAVFSHTSHNEPLYLIRRTSSK